MTALRYTAHFKSCFFTSHTAIVGVATSTTATITIIVLSFASAARQRPLLIQGQSLLFLGKLHALKVEPDASSLSVE